MLVTTAVGFAGDLRQAQAVRRPVREMTLAAISLLFGRPVRDKVGFHSPSTAQVDVWADRLEVTFVRNAPLVPGSTRSRATGDAIAPRAFHKVVVPLAAPSPRLGRHPAPADLDAQATLP